MNCLVTKLVFIVVFLQWMPHAKADINYKIEKIIPGYSIKLIEQGYTLGGLKEKTEIPAPVNNDAKEIIVQESQKYAQEIDQIKESQKTLRKDLLVPAKEAATALALGSPIPTTVAVKMPIKIDGFLKCAQEALPILKIAYLAELNGKSNESRKILSALEADRADESGLTPLGVVCGRYLGPAATSAPTLLDEIKALTAFLLRNGVERMALLQAFVVSHHRESSGSMVDLWSYYWDKISALAALTSLKLPSFKEMETELLSMPPLEVKGMEVKIMLSKDKLRMLRETGLQFAKLKMESL